jgi:two-component system response regulator NreC
METKVVLVDDHTILREGLRLVLDAQPQVTVVGEAADGREAIELVERLRPNVVVMDIAMPNLNGLEATRQIKKRWPEVRVVILTMHENHQYLQQIVRAGATGAVLKRSAGTELIMAVTAAAQGQSYFSPSIASMLVDDYRMRLDSDIVDNPEVLTEREREVLQLIAEGKTNQEIADILFLSIKTVQTHRAHILEKLNVHDRTDLVKYAIRTGMVTSD